MSAPDQRRRIGNRLREMRLIGGLNQDELAARAGISVKSLFNVENGRYTGTSPASLVAVCKALGVDPDDLNGNEDPSPDAEKLLRTLAKMPVDVRVTMYVVGGWLSRLDAEERSAAVDRLILMTVADDSA